MNNFVPISAPKVSDTGSIKIKLRRKFPRRNFNSSIGLLCSGEYQIYNGIIIGEGGLSVRSLKEFKLESEVLLTFRIPKGNIILIRAIIKNQFKLKNDLQYYDVGLEFINLQFSDKKLIRTYVAARSELEVLSESLIK